MTRPPKPANDNGPKAKRAVRVHFRTPLPIGDAELRLYETHAAALIQRLTAAASNDRLDDVRLEKDASDASGDLRAGLDEAASRE